MSLQTEFENAPKEFAGKHAFYPADQATGYAPVNETVIGGGRFKGFRHTVVNQAQKVARVDLAKGADRVRGEVCLVNPSLNGGVGLPVYFLPWDHRGAAVELTIPNRTPTLANTVHPRFFFTAVLSGCSIMFKGTAQNPTIYHCGTGGTGHGETPTTGNANDFFVDLLTRCNDVHLGTVGAIASQVRSGQYMVPNARSQDAGLNRIATLETEVDTAMKALYKNRLKMVATSSWGVIFGVRAANTRDWKFYMQTNVTIQYFDMKEVLDTVVKTRLCGLIKKTTQVKTMQQGDLKSIAKPMELTKVFPGVGVAKATSTWKSLRGF